jgi:chromosome segregation ATPase
LSSTPEWPSLVTSLDRQIGNLRRERDICQRNISILADKNQRLIDIVTKLASAFDQQTRAVHIEQQQPGFSMSTLMWDLQRAQRDLAHSREMSSNQQQVIESQSCHIEFLDQKISELQKTIAESSSNNSFHQRRGLVLRQSNDRTFRHSYIAKRDGPAGPLSP